ncbi:hypothetical protein GCM10027168_68680 [Streptomyces capparidis]
MQISRSQGNKRRRRRSDDGLPQPGVPVAPVKVGAVVLLATVLPVTLFTGGSAMFTQTRLFLDWGAGVLSLVSLSCAVLWGIAATDRLFLQPMHRLVAQGVHRAAAVSGVLFLFVHVVVKVSGSSADADPVSAVVPFADSTRPVLVGLGTLAGYGFVGVVATGALRSAFASTKRARVWRVLHMAAYPAWGMALVHGLRSGRLAAGWVFAAYAICVLGVIGALFVRMRTRPAHSKEAALAAAATARPEVAALPRQQRRAFDQPRLERPRQVPAGLLPPDGLAPPMGALGSDPEAATRLMGAVPPGPGSGGMLGYEEPTQVMGAVPGDLGAAGLTTGGIGMGGGGLGGSGLGGGALGVDPLGSPGLGPDQEPTQVMGAVPPAPGSNWGRDDTRGWAP